MPYYEEFCATFGRQQQLDSLEALFFQIDYSKPFVFKTDLVIYIDYRIHINRPMIKEGEAIMQELVTRKIQEFESIDITGFEPRKQHYFNIYRELFRQHLFDDIQKYFRLCSYPFLRNVLLSNTFFQGYTTDSLYPLSYLNSILFGDIIYIRESRSGIIDYAQLHKSIFSTLTDTIVQKYARFLCLQRMIDDNYQLANQYADLFDTDYNDQFLIDQLNDKILKCCVPQTDDFELISYENSKERVKYDQIISNYTGSVIYVDFWASWCAPCLKAMPSAEKLREDYLGKDIKFIYISLDKSIENWETETAMSGLESNAINYFATSFDKSNIYNELEITTIPRYLIYSKEGKLVNPNAPGPEGAEIRELLERYLGE